MRFSTLESRHGTQSAFSTLYVRLPPFPIFFMGSKSNAGAVLDRALLQPMAATGFLINRLLFRLRLFRNTSPVIVLSARQEPRFWPCGPEANTSAVLLLSRREAPQLSQGLRPKAPSRCAGGHSMTPPIKLVCLVAMGAFISALQILLAELPEIW